MKYNTKREPTLYIVGNPDRVNEIVHILVDEWGGNHRDYTFDNSTNAYFVDTLGYVNCCRLDNTAFKEAVANGWMKEFKLPEKPLKPFDKVVVRLKGTYNNWHANLYSHEDNEFIYFIGDVKLNKSHIVVLPYNEQTKKLIGTRDEWKGGEE